jgi:hypothetical protein
VPEPVLASPEALVPADAPCFVRGIGLETLQAHLDAFCNKYPSALSMALRLRLGPVLSRPYLVAADGTRAWGAVFLAPDLREEPVWLLPVEDEGAFRQAAAACLEGVRVRFVRGYALLGKDEAILDRLGCEGAGLAPSPLASDVVVRLNPAAFRGRGLEGFLAPLLSRLPLRCRGLLADLGLQVSALEAGCTLGERGAEMTFRLQSVPGSGLADFLSRQVAKPLRWIGLASSEAAVVAECHVDTRGARSLLDVLAAMDPMGAALAPVKDFCGGDALLTMFPGEPGWQVQAVCRLAEVREGERFLEHGLPGLLKAVSEASGGLDCSSQVQVGREEGALKLQEAVVTLAAKEGQEGWPWKSLLGEDARHLPFAGAVSKDLCVVALGSEAGDRVLATAPSLGQGLVPTISEAHAALLEGLPGEANAWVILSVGRMLSLLGRTHPGLVPGRPVSGSLALALCCEGEAALGSLVVPGEVLGELSAWVLANKLKE